MENGNNIVKTTTTGAAEAVTAIKIVIRILFLST